MEFDILLRPTNDTRIYHHYTMDVMHFCEIFKVQKYIENIKIFKK